MNRICKVILAAAAMAALAAPAMAADKLIVKDAAGTADVFKVDDTGSIIGVGLSFNPATKRLGLGTAAPQSSLNLVEQAENFDRGFTIGQYAGAATGSPGTAAAIINIKRSRGAEGAHLGVVSGDNIAAIHGQAHDGSTFLVPASIFIKTDGAVSVGSVPTAITFAAGNVTAKPERLRISSSGNVVVGNNAGAATGALATTATDGFLHIPTVAGTLTSCATATQYTGHVPVWFDATNNKICTCNGTALKCTVALN